MAKIRVYKCLLVKLCCLLCVITTAQQTSIVIHSVDTTDAFITNTFKPKQSFVTAQLANQYAQKFISLVQANGYISASLDSSVQHNDSLHLYIYTGRQFIWNNVTIPAQYNNLLRDDHLEKDKKITTDDVIAARENLLQYFERNGHPFAKVYFDSVTIDDNKLGAALKVDEGIIYKMDSIRLYGGAKISKEFLYNYLGIKPSELYNAEKLDDIDKRLAELPYLQQEVPWQLTMLGTGFLIDLYLQKKQSNQVDALIGFLPASQQLGGKLLLTVDANILLRNAFATGETIGLTYQQIQPKSPRLNLLFQKPYLFGSSFGFDGSFNLYKKDSSYLNIDARIGVQYFLSAKQRGTLFYQTFRTNMLDVDTNLVKQTKRLPDFIDVSTNNIGLQYQYLNTNYRFNPRSGNELTVEVAAGKKKIRKNNGIVNIKDGSFNYSSLYDTTKLNSYFVRAEMQAAQYFPLGKQSALRTGLYAGILQSPNYYRNELFQIGGFKLLRGFDEESIFASKYAVASFEYRYLIDMNSYFFTFIDGGIARYESNSISNTNNYIGAGAGVSFQTKQGVFNFSYAVGKAGNTKFNIRQSKIHFGYVSVF